MASFSLLKNKGESEETSTIFCGNVNFPQIDREISLYGGIKLNNRKFNYHYQYSSKMKTSNNAVPF